MWMSSSRTGLGAISLCWLATVASSSVSPVDTATLRSMGLSRKEIKEVKGEVIEEAEQAEIEEEVDEEEEPWKTNDDWWKDPLAMFSDDEDEEVMPKPVEKEDSPVIESAETLEREEEEIDDSSIPVMDDDIIEEVKEDFKESATREDRGKETVVVGTTSSTPSSKEEDKGITKGDKGKPLLASPFALLVPLVLKFQKMLTSVPKLQTALTSVPIVPLMGAAVIGKAFIGLIESKRSSDQDEGNVEYAESDDDLSTGLDQAGVRDVEEDDLDVSLETTDTSREVQYTTEVTTPRRGSAAWMRLRGVLTRTQNGRRIPPARDLLVQVESMRQVLSKKEAERASMEREYEKASFQLQEAQTEVSTLTTTTRYLKAQLRDNEEVMNKALRAERSKAKEELTRMKEAMIGILNKERRFMREELKRQTAELRALLAESTDGNGESGLMTEGS